MIRNPHSNVVFKPPYSDVFADNRSFLVAVCRKGGRV